MWNSLRGSRSPMILVQNGITCMYPRAPTVDIAYLRNADSTWISPNTIAGSKPARLDSYHTVSRNSRRTCMSGSLLLKRSDISPSQRRYLMRSLMSLKLGFGGRASANAFDSAMRTEPAKASSFRLPAQAVPAPMQSMSKTSQRQNKRPNLCGLFCSRDAALHSGQQELHVQCIRLTLLVSP